VVPPALDDDPGLSARVENLSVKQFVAKPGVEALEEAVILKVIGVVVALVGGLARSRSTLGPLPNLAVLLAIRASSSNHISMGVVSGSTSR
jgi:hypothetical protein